MGTVKDNEEYWNSIEKLSFSFENNEMGQLFKTSNTDTDKLWADTCGISTSEGSQKRTDDYKVLKPLLSVISEKTLCSILATDKSQKFQSETIVHKPDVTLRKILIGESYSLEPYKSLASKTALLDAAIASGNGNAILIIVLFLTKTLKRSLVQRILAERKDAVNVYIRYLSTRLQINEITDILTMLGQPVDAAMKTLHIIIKNTRDPDRLLSKLRNCYKTQFSTLADCREASFVQSYIKFLEWQTTVRKIHGNEELELNTSVLECLRHVSKGHWNLPEGTLMSPEILSQVHNISPRQYQKVALEVRASAGEWEDVDGLLLTKGWLGSKKLQLHLPIEDVIKILYKNKAPTHILEKYLKHVDNVEKRLELAKNMHCFRIVIDIFVQLADRAALTEYKTKLQPQSEEYFYAENALRLPTIKWKS
ncbi:spermatogenesis-defective protein 39 homolog [Megalopta genalis]|uniref:spermatogenesis-defective protein 39 homolog n=1 Tax=Megalopta genalis TaxID=115081 RepID=UPI0014434186|nr:spermatogenesis-defective protein 39 homolog [Megalopta genalis]